jgi:hypothetical protein
MSIIFAFLCAMIHITCVCGYLRKYSGRAEKRYKIYTYTRLIVEVRQNAH